MQQEIHDILASVSKPYRYAGGEIGSRPKPWDEVNVRVALAFPDIYEMGMSHLGLSILYHVVNDREGMCAERVFAPWADMEAELRRREVPLFSLETHHPLADFDIVGFSLAYELTTTNVLMMLELAGIPLRAADRRDGHPIVIAGGPCTFNPEPVAPFFDAIVIGDGEDAILEIANAVREGKRDGIPRREMLEGLSRIPGVYVPAFRSTIHDSRSTTDAKATVPDLNAAPFPKTPIVPYAATHDRIAVEAGRGCARGCRFCQAGYIYRPVRQRRARARRRVHVRERG